MVDQRDRVERALIGLAAGDRNGGPTRMAFCLEFAGPANYKDDDGNWVLCPDLHTNYDGGYRLNTQGYGLRCLEVLPRTYYLRVWKNCGDDEDTINKDIGPFDGYIHPKASHI